MIKLPVYQQTSANFKYKISLELKSVEVHLTWNVRNEFFHFHFTDEEGVKLYSIKAVPAWPLLYSNRAHVDFDGDFLILKEDINEEESLTYDNLGTLYNLYYLTEEEVQAWREENGLSA